MNEQVESGKDADLTTGQAVPVLSDRVRHALAVTRRGCEELIPEADWIKKLVKSEASGQKCQMW